MDTGLHPDVSFADYLGLKAISRSLLKDLLERPPRYVKMRLDGEIEEPDSRDAEFGTVAHSACLQDGAGSSVLAYPDYRTADARNARNRVYSEGKTPILVKEYKHIKAMKAEFDEFCKCAEIPTDCTEQTIIWEEGGLLCKARADILAGPRCIDYKTTLNSEPAGWARKTIWAGGYDLQAAWYLRGLKAVTGEDYDFYFLPQEKRPPYTCSLVTLTPTDLRMSEERIDSAIDTYRHCLDQDCWPNIHDLGAYVAEAPQYKRYEWEESK